MISFQSCVGSAFGSSPIRWIETPEYARSQYAASKIPDKPVDPDVGKPRSESGDILDISLDTQRTLTLSRSDAPTMSSEQGAGTEKPEKPVSVQSTTETLPTGEELTPEEQQKVAELKARDQEVRIHEMAHAMAAGPYVTSGPSYTYQTGPDGKGYAVGGSVGIDTSPVAGDPEATIQKMQTIAAAAMAPSQPSGQDHKVAAAARQAETKARAELSQMQTDQQQEEQAQSDENDETVFTVVRVADRMAETASNSVADSVMPSLVRAAGAEFAPGSAYKAQSTMTLATPRFSAFA